MKPNIPRLREWAQALRSGKYTQGKYRLRSKDNTFCCLGVACDLVDSTNWSESTMHRDAYSWDGTNTKTMPMYVSREFGLELNLDALPMRLGFWGGRVTFSALNDIENLTFDQIADVIDQCCEALEK